MLRKDEESNEKEDETVVSNIHNFEIFKMINLRCI